MIQIEFAHNADKQLIHINEVARGLKNTYFCTTCGIELLPKIGKIKKKHFAHREDSCLGVSGSGYYVPDKYVPKRLDAVGYHEWYYENLQNFKATLLDRIAEERKSQHELSELIRDAKEWLTDAIDVHGKDTYPIEQALKRLQQLVIDDAKSLKSLIDAFSRIRLEQVRQYNELKLVSRTIRYKTRYTTKKKRVLSTAVSQYENVNTASAATVAKNPVVPDALSDLLINLWERQNSAGSLGQSEAKLAEILPVINRETLMDQMSLYYLRVELPGDKVIFKIGITGREMEQRLKEIRVDLKALEVVDIKVIAFVPRMAHLEIWYKRKFADYRYPFGHHQEYFFYDQTKWFKALVRYAKKVNW